MSIGRWSPRLLIALLPLATACASQRPSYTPTPGAVFFTGAGDIAECGSPGAEATARLLDSIPGWIWTTGDNAYPAGSVRDYARCFHPTWGRHKGRIRPTPGNHEYWTPGAIPYFAYFGEAAGPADQGWYTFEYGGWRVVALNSNVETAPGSRQIRWLRRTLAQDTSRCTLAYFHHPLVSSGAHGEITYATDGVHISSLWAALYEGGVNVVLGGHDHHYERFAPVVPGGRVDRDRGIRQFVVGTGGGPLRPLRPTTHAASEEFIEGVHGVLKLELLPDRYAWEFVSVRGRVLDSGSAMCR